MWILVKSLGLDEKSTKFLTVVYKYCKKVTWVILLQNCFASSPAKPAKVPATAHMAMVEVVAEGEAYAQRHQDRGWDEGM